MYCVLMSLWICRFVFTSALQKVVVFVYRYQQKCDEMAVRAGQTRMTYDQMIADRDEIIHYLEGLQRQKSVYG